MFFSGKKYLDRKEVDMKYQKEIGTIISYLNITLNMVISIFFTPFLISSLGNSEYGVYRIVQSFSGQLSIMSFGISALIVRNIIYYDTKKLKKEKENFLFMAIIISYILGFIIFLIGSGLYLSIDKIYNNSLSIEEIVIAKRLFILLVVNIVITVISDSYMGIIMAHERFIVSSGSKMLKLLLRIVLIFVLLKLNIKSIGIVISDLCVSLILYLFVILYNKIILKEKVKFYYFDKETLRISFLFSIAIFLQAVINQVNQNLDSVILGIMTSSTIVTLYSLALTLYTSFNSLVSVISGVFGPQAAKLVAKNASKEELTDFVIIPGRVQLMIAGLAITGFLLFGKNFIKICVGNDFIEAYYIVLILIIPVVIPLIENVTEAILDAMLKRMGRSIILFVMCIINVIISILLIKRIGYIGAAFGTAISVIIGNGIILNIYLKKVVGLQIFRMFKEIFKGIWLANLLAIILGIVLLKLPDTIVGFLIKVIFYTLIYSSCIYLIGMNKIEKNYIMNFFKLRRNTDEQRVK